MAPFGERAVWLELSSDRFDHSSELPPESNAGNRFYGRDVAEFVATGLDARGFDASYFDEDWGWQVHARRADGSVLEVSVYHNPEGDPARASDWSLMLRLLQKERLLGLVPWFRETVVDDVAIGALEDLFSDVGVTLERTRD